MELQAQPRSPVSRVVPSSVCVLLMLMMPIGSFQEPRKPAKFYSCL